MLVALVTILAAASVGAGDDRDEKPVSAAHVPMEATTVWHTMGRMTGLESQPEEKKPADKKTTEEESPTLRRKKPRR